MLTFKEFDGINNVLPAKRLAPSEFVRALNVDIGLSKELTRRSGYSEVLDTCHKNLHQASGFMLVTCDGDLTAIWPSGTRTVIYPSLGVERVWYCNLPDGRTAFSNGLIQGVTNGVSVTGWGIPIPDRIGTLTEATGQLYDGDYQYQIAYVRNSDGLEGGPEYSNPFPVTTGGIKLIGLPVLDGYSIRVYLSSHDGGEAYYAGTTTTDEFTFSGKNSELVIPARTDLVYPAPSQSTVQAFYRGRVLVAEGNVLYASKHQQWEFFERKKDYKQFSSNITLICPVDDGVYVGTETELAFLAGQSFDTLQYRQVMSSPVVLGSGVLVRGDMVRLGDGRGQGSAILCIADSVICAGFNSGQVVRLTEGRYSTSTTEVAATFRKINGIPQYIAIPQDSVVPPVDLSVTLVQTNRYDNAPSFYAHTLSSVTEFSPIDLFASSEVGAWYDPSDLTTMFQNSTGTTPVTADGQPVGLILDKHIPAVPMTAGWIKTTGDGVVTVVGNTITITGATTSTVVEYQDYNTNFKRVTFIADIAGAVGAFVHIGGQPDSPVQGENKRTGVGGIYTRFSIASGSATFEITLQEQYDGNHASQATAAARPLYKTSGLAKYNDYDAVDDVLDTAFPSSLGSSCTVGRANVGSAATILTAQTIGTSYANSTDNAGLVIVNRALSTQETTDLTAWLTEKGATA